MQKTDKKSNALKFIVKPKKKYYEGYCLGGCNDHRQGTCGGFCGNQCGAQR